MPPSWLDRWPHPTPPAPAALQAGQVRGVAVVTPRAHAPGSATYAAPARGGDRAPVVRAYRRMKAYSREASHELFANLFDSARAVRRAVGSPPVDGRNSQRVPRFRRSRYVFLVGARTLRGEQSTHAPKPSRSGVEVPASSACSSCYARRSRHVHTRTPEICTAFSFSFVVKEEKRETRARQTLPI